MWRVRCSDKPHSSFKLAEATLATTSLVLRPNESHIELWSAHMKMDQGLVTWIYTIPYRPGANRWKVLQELTELLKCREQLTSRDGWFGKRPKFEDADTVDSEVWKALDDLKAVIDVEGVAVEKGWLDPPCSLQAGESAALCWLAKIRDVLENEWQVARLAPFLALDVAKAVEGKTTVELEDEILKSAWRLKRLMAIGQAKLRSHGFPALNFETAALEDKTVAPSKQTASVSNDAQERTSPRHEYEDRSSRMQELKADSKAEAEGAKSTKAETSRVPPPASGVSRDDTPLCEVVVHQVPSHDAEPKKASYADQINFANVTYKSTPSTLPAELLSTPSQMPANGGAQEDVSLSGLPAEQMPGGGASYRNVLLKNSKKAKYLSSTLSDPHHAGSGSPGASEDARALTLSEQPEETQERGNPASKLGSQGEDVSHVCEVVDERERRGEVKKLQKTSHLNPDHYARVTYKATSSSSSWHERGGSSAFFRNKTPDQTKQSQSENVRRFLPRPPKVVVEKVDNKDAGKKVDKERAVLWSTLKRSSQGRLSDIVQGSHNSPDAKSAEMP